MPLRVFRNKISIPAKLFYILKINTYLIACAVQYFIKTDFVSLSVLASQNKITQLKTGILV